MNRLSIFIHSMFVFALASAAAVAGSEDRTELAPPFAVTIGGKALDLLRDAEGRVAQDNAYPWVADFDGDGKPDLLVGQHTHLRGTDAQHGGRLRVFRNIGNKGRPAFGDPVWFDATVPTGRIPDGCNVAGFSPQVADYDGDGLDDLVSGSSCCEHAFGFYVFRRLKDGGFAPRRRIDLDFGDRGDLSEFPTTGLKALVAVADWNGDGVPDLLAGGNTRVLGVAYGPLAGKETVKVDRVWPKGQEPFRPMTTNPVVVDWDGDGLSDLVVGGVTADGRGVHWLRNVGTRREPKMAGPKLLLAETGAARSPASRLPIGTRAGGPDLIVSRKVSEQVGGATGVYRDIEHKVWLYARIGALNVVASLYP